MLASKYAEDSAIILFTEDRFVLRLLPNEVNDLREVIRGFDKTKVLAVRNGTYEVMVSTAGMIKLSLL